MATVTGYTATKMQQIENSVVVGGIIEDNNLFLIRNDGTTIDAGIVGGSEGPPGPAADFSGYVEPILNLGDVSGAVNIDLSLSNVWVMNPTGALVISFLNTPLATELAPLTFIILNSNFSITWPVGTKFSEGLPPELDGETWLSIALIGSTPHVGRSWRRVSLS